MEQTMTDEEFFNRLCATLDINQYDNDEYDVVRGIEVLQSELDTARAENAKLRAALEDMTRRARMAEGMVATILDIPNADSFNKACRAWLDQKALEDKQR